MKKKVLGGFAVLAVAAVVAFNVNMNNSEKNSLSDLALANVEAFGCENGESCGYTNHGPTADRFWSNTLYCKNKNRIGCSY